MTELLFETKIKREVGYLYFVGKDGNVYRAKMARGVKLSPAEKAKREAERKQKKAIMMGARRAVRQRIFAEAKKKIAEEYKSLNK
jgi:hypothetical protein